MITPLPEGNGYDIIDDWSIYFQDQFYQGLNPHIASINIKVTINYFACCEDDYLKILGNLF